MIRLWTEILFQTFLVLGFIIWEWLFIVSYWMENTFSILRMAILQSVMQIWNNHILGPSSLGPKIVILFEFIHVRMRLIFKIRLTPSIRDQCNCNVLISPYDFICVKLCRFCSNVNQSLCLCQKTLENRVYFSSELFNLMFGLNLCICYNFHLK